MGIVQKALHLPADNRVQSIIRAKQHDVIRLDVRIDKIETVVRMILIKDIVGIITLVQESQ